MNTFTVFHHTPKVVRNALGHTTFAFEKIGEVRVFGDSQDAIAQAKKQGFIAPIVQPL